jgi:hypothetical protein
MGRRQRTTFRRRENPLRCDRRGIETVRGHRQPPSPAKWYILPSELSCIHSNCKTPTSLADLARWSDSNSCRHNTLTPLSTPWKIHF